MDDKRYAVLIDSDNISSKYISNILDEMTKYGVITYKRIYGDWTSPRGGQMEERIDGEFNYTNTAVSQHSRQECY